MIHWIFHEEGHLFLPHYFYLILKDDVMTGEEYEGVKKNLPNHKTKRFI